MRWIIRIVVTLVSLAVVAVAAVFLIPAERIARIAESQFEANTGRKLTITGGVSPTLWPRLGVTLEGVAISNADWAGAEPMLEASRLDVGVGMSALLGRDVVVEAFEVEAPIIRLARNAQGQANWDFLTELGGEDEEDGGGPGVNSVSLPKGTITGATIIYDDASTGLRKQLEALDATLRLDDLAGEAQVDVSALMDGQSVSLSAQVAGLQPLLDGGVQGISATATLGANQVSFDGVAGIEPVQAKGGVEGVVADHPSLFALMGQPAPRIPEGLGQRVEFGGNLTLTPEMDVFFRDASLALDQNRLAGDIDVRLAGEVPQVTARLAGDRLDFSAMSTDTSEGDGAANAGAGGWSEARLDVSGLSAVNGDFTFKANALDLGSIQLGKTALSGSLDRSRMVTRFENIEAFDGLVSGQFVVNNRAGLSVGGDMIADRVAMQRLLSDFAGFERLVADASLSLKFLGVGDTLDAIMRSLSGEGRLDVGAGELLGLDIAGMIRNFDAAYVGEGSKTVFDDITASFTIADGTLRNDDLNFTASLLTATGAGALDLGAQTVDYRLVPVALAAQIDEGISVPVLITGPWSNVKYRPDLKSLLDRELEEEKEKLKAAARAREAELKAKAEAKLVEELGVTRGEGQSVEKAVKDGLEEKAKDALRSLFD
jgi:AsmA protein